MKQWSFKNTDLTSGESAHLALSELQKSIKMRTIASKAHFLTLSPVCSFQLSSIKLYYKLRVQVKDRAFLRINYVQSHNERSCLIVHFLQWSLKCGYQTLEWHQCTEIENLPGNLIIINCLNPLFLHYNLYNAYLATNTLIPISLW